MDFFQAQEKARKKSGWLVFFYFVAIAAIALTIYAVIVGAYVLTEEKYHPGYWHPELLGITSAAVLLVIGSGTLFKVHSLRGGGSAVALSLGGELVSPLTPAPQYRQYVNIVEEMAIASGIPMPAVFVLPERGINAFAAGYTPKDAAVAVTQGALERLSRDELQGVVAHEFSHILNGDMRLNIRLISLLFGIFLLTIIGRILIRVVASSNRSSRNSRGGGGIVLGGMAFALALIIVGGIGVFFGRIIQAAVSRQREFLADASAVQFTRNPAGIAGALKKIGALSTGSRIEHSGTDETSHMFFANAMSGFSSNLFATHPPLLERIRAIEGNH